MNEQERYQIAAAESPEKMFTALWTRKEAVLKYQGTGIIDDLHNVLSNLNDLRISTFQVFPTTICSVCTINN